MANENQPSQGIPPELVLNILQARASRDKELALHLEAAVLQASVQQQQMTIQQLLAETEEEAEGDEPEPDDED